eukprot:Tbor_TRINITY_DN5802_c0_g3::TRINITY_DN5802_c0_g3_i3::g.7212::m.7212
MNNVAIITNGWAVHPGESTYEKGPQAPKSRFPKGPRVSGTGAITSKRVNKGLNDVQLDNILHRIFDDTDIDWMSAAFVARKNTRILLRQLKKGRGVLLPLCIKSHWVLGRMSPSNRAMVLEIFDPAPSATTKLEIEKLVKEPHFSHFGDIKIVYGRCPRQPKDSSQCGLHLLINATALAKGKRLNSDKACHEKLFRNGEQKSSSSEFLFW